MRCTAAGLRVSVAGGSSPLSRLEQHPREVLVAAILVGAQHTAHLLAVNLVEDVEVFFLAVLPSASLAVLRASVLRDRILLCACGPLTQRHPPQAGGVFLSCADAAALGGFLYVTFSMPAQAVLLAK